MDRTPNGGVSNVKVKPSLNISLLLIFAIRCLVLALVIIHPSPHVTGQSNGALVH